MSSPSLPQGTRRHLHLHLHLHRLTAVNDAVSGSYEVDFVKRGSGTYGYYANGALKSDENEEITNIVYNTYLNLPEEITLTGGRWIKYTYDGEGKLLKTEYNTGEYWEYVDGFVFKNGQPYQAVIADGRARYESGNWVNEFDYKDHLGNTRVSFKEGSTGAELTARTDFDPWGVRLNGTGVVNSYSNRWEMRGKEKEMTFGLNRVDYGARVYNPTIGRWDKVDPMAEQYYPYSTFNYTLNNPVSNTDPNGMWVERGGGLFTDNPEEIAAFMDGIRGNGGGDGKKKQSERERLSELVEVRGKLYHKNTTNRPAKLANWINSLFGGDSDYFVEHKPYNSDEQEFNDNLQATALGVGGAHLVGKVVVGVLSSSAARSTSNIAVQFGKTENQIFHAFRHTDALGLDRSVVQSTIQNHFKTVSSQVVAGKPLNQIVEIGGQRIQYTAFKLPDGTFNIGRIHGIK